MKKFLVLFIFVIIGYFALNLSDDIVFLKYDNYKQLQKDEIISKGWLPNILPDTITNIEINNNLDLNTSWGSFHLPKDSFDTFVEKLEKKAEYYKYKNWAFFIYVGQRSDRVEYFLNITIKP